MEFLSNYIWKKNVRETNEDSLSIKQVVINGKTLLMAIVCDGIGSLPEGELSSSFVVSSLKAQFEQVGRHRKNSLKTISHLLSRQLYSCHEELKERGMGTTACVVVVQGRRAVAISVGDSRIYIGRRKMKQISRDTVDARGRLTAAIGVGSYKGLQQRRLRIRKDCKILICTDGFYRRNEEIVGSFGGLLKKRNEEAIEEVLTTINNWGREKGEKDNASAIAIWRIK